MRAYEVLAACPNCGEVLGDFDKIYLDTISKTPVCCSYCVEERNANDWIADEIDRTREANHV